MTLERQKYLEPFIVAQNQGKTIQYNNTLNNEGWKDVDWVMLTHINCDADNDEYRIKPEPREWYIIRSNFKDGAYMFDSLERAKSIIKERNHDEIIKVHEVIE